MHIKTVKSLKIVKCTLLIQSNSEVFRTLETSLKLLLFALFQDLEGQKLLERGAQLMTQHKSVNRTWSKDQQQQQHKRRKFQKPKEDD